MTTLLTRRRRRALTLRDAGGVLSEREVGGATKRRIGMAFRIAHFRAGRERAASRWIAHGDATLLGPPARRGRGSRVGTRQHTP